MLSEQTRVYLPERQSEYSEFTVKCKGKDIIRKVFLY